MTDDTGPTKERLSEPDSHYRKWLALGLNLPVEERVARLFDMWWTEITVTRLTAAEKAARLGPDAEDATPQRFKKAGTEWERKVIEVGEGDDKVSSLTYRMLDGSVLDNLASRKVITGDQYTAGVQLYQDWYLAGFASSGVIDPSKDVVDGGVIAGANDRVLDAAGRFAKALLAVGKVHSHPLINIILIEQPLNEYGLRRFAIKDEKDARLKAITALQLALEQLDYHYYGQRKTKGGSSHMDDYRPVIQPAS